MRPTDFARLNEPHPDDTDPPNAMPRAALGLELPRWTTLQTDILADFTEDAVTQTYRSQLRERLELLS